MEPIDTITIQTGPVKDVAHMRQSAEVIGAMLSALPHLFPPTTNLYDPKATEPATLALPAIWTDFDSFYRLAGAASAAADRFAKTEGDEPLRDASRALRSSCDGCHALYLRKYVSPVVLESDRNFDFTSALGRPLNASARRDGVARVSYEFDGFRLDAAARRLYVAGTASSGRAAAARDRRAAVPRRTTGRAAVEGGPDEGALAERGRGGEQPESGDLRPAARARREAERAPLHRHRARSRLSIRRRRSCVGRARAADDEGAERSIAILPFADLDGGCREGLSRAMRSRWTSSVRCPRAVAFASPRIRRASHSAVRRRTHVRSRARSP